MRRTWDTTLTKQTRHRKFIALLVSALLFASAASADEYRDARAELIAAYQQQDYAAMLVAAEKALAARPGFPGGLFNLALTQTLNGDHTASLQTLRLLLDKRVDFGADELDEFAAVRELEGWQAYAEDLKRLYAPVGSAAIHARYAEPNFVPEGIAIADDGTLYLGSIHTGQLIKLGHTAGVLSHRDSHWSVFGMRLHPDGSLWFASAAVPQLQNVGEDEGKTGLFRLDLDSGEISKAAILPQYESAQVLGDLIIADGNTIYTTDSLTGAIYRYYIDSNEFEIFVERGRLGSPQGLVLDASGDYLYVADYIGGLFRVSVLDGSLAKVKVPEDLSDYGIDGLYRYGNELLLIQNGIRPHRVAALRLDDSGKAVTGGRVLASNLIGFDEPTLGTVHGDDFYFVANSHWNRFDADNQLPDGLAGPLILRIPLE